MLPETFIYGIVSNYRIRIVNTSGIINTFAGNGVSGSSGNGGPATAAELDAFYGNIAVDASGNVYIATWNPGTVRIVNTSGIINAFAGNGDNGYTGDGGPATAAELENALGMAVDASGNVYIGDYGSNVIRKVNTSGIISTFAGNGVQGYWVTEDRLLLLNFKVPDDIAVDASGNVYFSEVGDVILVVNTSGIINVFAGNDVQGFSGDGGQATAAELHTCCDFPVLGLGVDTANGNVYIADEGNELIRRVNNAGIIYNFAGDTASADLGVGDFGGDGGPATAARFNSPSYLAFDASENLYIVDAGNNRIRKVTPGYVSTGINALSNSKGINVYPVPNTGYFTVSGVTQGQVIELYNYLGQKVYTSSQPPPNGGGASFACQINISSLPNGIYLMRILNKEGTVVTQKKIVKTE